MGFILFGVGIGSFESIQAGLIYMIIYVIMSICSFSILLSLNLAPPPIVPYSAKFSRRIILAFFVDWHRSSKIKLRNILETVLMLAESLICENCFHNF